MTIVTACLDLAHGKNNKRATYTAFASRQFTVQVSFPLCNSPAEYQSDLRTNSSPTISTNQYSRHYVHTLFEEYTSSLNCARIYNDKELLRKGILICGIYGCDIQVWSP